MKITTKQLKKLIQEELKNILEAGEEEEQADIQQRTAVKSDVKASGKAEDKNKVAAKKQQRIGGTQEIEQLIVQYIQKLAKQVPADELKKAVYKVNAIVQKA